ncbi:MAG: sugar ABC transporter permease [Acholeplasmataceae bacterium]|nr:sugar ABC transporter permease [Acholeplasmataceae bacterium]
MKFISILKAVASGLVWGFGQILNKQFLKGLFFFVFFASFLAIELSSSRYFEDIDPYERIGGEDFSDEFVQTQIYTRYVGNNVVSETFNQYIIDIGGHSEMTFERLVTFIAQDLSNRNQPQYTNIGTSAVTLAVDLDFDERTQIQESGNLWVRIVGTTRTFFMASEGTYSQINPVTGVLIESGEKLLDPTGLVQFNKTGMIFRDQPAGLNPKTYIRAIEDGTTRYMDMNGAIYTLSSSVVRQVDFSGPLYVIDNKLYEYFEPGLIYDGTMLSYRDTVFTIQFKRIMRDILAIGIFPIDETSYTKFVFRVYLELNPTLKTDYENNYNHFFYDKAGLFVKGYWGILTLGEVDNITYSQFYGLLNPVLRGTTGDTYVVNIGLLSLINLQGHVSRQILLQSLISIILSVFFLFFMAWSIRDAYKVSEAKRKKNKVLKDIAYFKDVYQNGFEYIVLSPALFVLAFISIMPISFGFLVAFTSMSGANSMGNLFQWVGFQNFTTFFNFSEGLGALFGRAFWSVLGWTVIWAIASTITVFFGGFFQALVLNSESVVFKKFWRTLFIIPWAMPAILSQMIFSVMFKDSGWINSFLRSIGIYDFLTDLNMIGVKFSELSGISKLFFLGEQNIEWFSNINNPTFVRVTLIVLNIWLGFPYFMALMTGVMTAIDKSLYEAADIDGATKYQKIKSITLPLVLYSTAPILIMTLSGNFNNFGVIYFITQGGPNLNDAARGFAGDTDILISWMYKLTTEQGKAYYNIASVFSVLIFLFVGSVTAWNLTKTRAFKGD